MRSWSFYDQLLDPAILCQQELAVRAWKKRSVRGMSAPSAAEKPESCRPWGIGCEDASLICQKVHRLGEECVILRHSGVEDRVPKVTVTCFFGRSWEGPQPLTRVATPATGKRLSRCVAAGAERRSEAS